MCGVWRVEKERARACNLKREYINKTEKLYRSRRKNGRREKVIAFLDQA